MSLNFTTGTTPSQERIFKKKPKKQKQTSVYMTYTYSNAVIYVNKCAILKL